MNAVGLQNPGIELFCERDIPFLKQYDTKIMIPMAKPSIITVIMFNFLSFWNEYIIAYTLMDGNDTLAMGLKNLMAVERTATVSYTHLDVYKRQSQVTSSGSL